MIRIVKNILLGFTVSSLLFGLCACGGESMQNGDKTDGAQNTEKIQDSTSASADTLSITVKRGSDDMTISRPDAAGDAIMGEEGVWTIFVYMCGSDLESDTACGTLDLEEMLAGTLSDNIRFVVQTGGALTWWNDYVDSSVTQRFLISDGEISEVYKGSLVNMGEESSLEDFISWGVEEYPSENMGLIFWDHGSGSISGVCFDDLNYEDSLYLSEIDSALLNVYHNKMTDKFAFIGFDACLMSTLETANIMASYADYMLASQELESGYGWDYETLASYISGNPDADMEEVGTVICDSYYSACELTDEDDEATLSLIDLSKIDDVLYSFNTLAQNMYQSAEETDYLSGMIRGIESADNFGGNNSTEGYTNMIDLMGMIRACSDYVEGCEDLENKLSSAIVYQVRGSLHTDAGGLSLYYPLSVEGSEELSIFSGICVSPYYGSFVDLLDHGSLISSDSDLMDEYYESEEYDSSELFYDYDDDYWYDDDVWEWSEYSSSDYDDYWDYVDEYETGATSSLITFESEPAINDDGYYSFTLDDDGLTYAADVYGMVFMDMGDDTVVSIGESWDIVYDWDTGVFEDGFDGFWLALPDGQILNTVIVGGGYDYIVYSTPILLNGEETNLRMIQYEDGYVEVEGTWDGIAESGASDRGIVALEYGDVIAPVYTIYDLDSDDYLDYYGYGYEVDDDFYVSYSLLPEGDYFYAFVIDDVFGNSYMTDFVELYSDGEGETFFY